MKNTSYIESPINQSKIEGSAAASSNRPNKPCLETPMNNITLHAYYPLQS